MAILGNFGEGYTKTGGNVFSRLAGYSSYIPILGRPLVLFFGVVGTAIETGKWLLRGKLGSAVTAATTGAAATATGVVGGATLAWGSAILTGRSLGTHSRKLTEVVAGATIKPQVLRSYTAGIGSIGGDMAPATPGRYATQIANERGQNSQEMYNSYMRGEGGAHVNELGSAYGRGA